MFSKFIPLVNRSSATEHRLRGLRMSNFEKERIKIIISKKEKVFELEIFV